MFSDVRKTIDDFKKVLKNFESRVEFTEDLQKMSDVGICFYSLAFSRRYFKFGVVRASYSCLGASSHVSKADCFDGNM